MFSFCVLRLPIYQQQQQQQQSQRQRLQRNHVKENGPSHHSRLCLNGGHNTIETKMGKPNQANALWSSQYETAYAYKSTARIRNESNGDNTRGGKKGRKTERSQRRMLDKREEWSASTHRHYLQCNKYNDGCSVTDMEYNMLLCELVKLWTSNGSREWVNEIEMVIVVCVYIPCNWLKWMDDPGYYP